MNLCSECAHWRQCGPGSAPVGWCQSPAMEDLASGVAGKLLTRPGFGCIHWSDGTTLELITYGSTVEITPYGPIPASQP